MEHCIIPGLAILAFGSLLLTVGPCIVNVEETARHEGRSNPKDGLPATLNASDKHLPQKTM